MYLYFHTYETYRRNNHCSKSFALSTGFSNIRVGLLWAIWVYKMTEEMKTGLQRLIVLADGLRHKKLLHTGTGVGIALGECPNFFTNDWEFRYISYNTHVPILKEDKSLDIIEAACRFFTIDRNTMFVLFLGNLSYCHLPIPFNQLNDFATKEEVAENIEIYVKYAPKYYSRP